MSVCVRSASKALLPLGRLAEAWDGTHDCLERLPPGHPLRIVALKQLRRIEVALREQRRL
jgi:hypothetical protein